MTETESVKYKVQCLSAPTALYNNSLLISFIPSKHRAAVMAISVLRRVVDNTVLSHISSAAMKTSTSMDGSDNKKTRHKLKKFLTRRPTLQAVRDKGYIKGTREQRETQTQCKKACCSHFSLDFWDIIIHKDITGSKVWLVLRWNQ